MSTESTSSAHRGRRFVLNVFWNWMGVGASLAAGLVLSPYMIRKIGPEGYGIWALSFALAEYYWFLDLGFRSATVKFVAHHWALKEFDAVSEVVNTGVSYAGLTAIIIFTLVALGGRYLDRFFQIPAAYRDSFYTLILLVTLNWCVGVVFSLFGSCLEAIQRFDYYNRVAIIVTVIRTCTQFVLLYKGFGLIPIGVAAVSSQLFGYFLHYFFFKKVLPSYHISPGQASRAMLRRMGSYGIHNFLGNLSTQVINMGPPVLIGHYMPTEYVGFFQIPTRLLSYTSDVVGKIGIITNSNTAELVARGEMGALTEIAVYTNRYCVMLFMPLAILFLTLGKQFLQLWVPKAASYSAPVLTILVVAYLIAFVGQFSSSMLLMGMARYQIYARGLLAEATIGFGSLIFIIPRYGIIGAAAVTATVMIANRGLFLPFLVSRIMNLPYLRFMNSIYTKPILIAAPIALSIVWLSHHGLPVGNWVGLITAALLICSVYYPVAFFFCLPVEHRQIVSNWLGNRMLRAREAS